MLTKPMLPFSRRLELCCMCFISYAHVSFPNSRCHHRAPLLLVFNMFDHWSVPTAPYPMPSWSYRPAAATPTPSWAELSCRPQQCYLVVNHIDGRGGVASVCRLYFCAVYPTVGRRVSCAIVCGCRPDMSCLALWSLRRSQRCAPLLLTL